jgi:hypothetical protein
MDSLKAFVAKNWTYHQDGNYYSCTKEFIRDIANTYIPSSEPGRSIRFERCLGILDRAEIIELLGKPTYPNRILRYNLDKGGEYEGEFLGISLEKGRRHIMIAHISSIE